MGLKGGSRPVASWGGSASSTSELKPKSPALVTQQPREEQLWVRVTKHTKSRT